MNRRALVCLSLAAIFAHATGCGSDGDDPVVSRFVGAVVENDAVVGVAIGSAGARLYVCGGPQTFQTTTQWLDGNVGADGNGTFAAAGGWSATITRSGDTVSGTVVTGDSRALTFSAARAVVGTLAGLYGVIDGGCMTGLVVRQASASDKPSAQGVWCSSDGTVAQVTPVEPLALSGGGLAVLVNVAGAERRLVVAPTVP